MATCGECGTEWLSDEDYLCALCRGGKTGDGIYEVVLESYDENVAPPHELMRIARADNVVFFEIAEYDESNGQEGPRAEFRNKAVFGVKFAALKKALEAIDF